MKLLQAQSYKNVRITHPHSSPRLTDQAKKIHAARPVSPSRLSRSSQNHSPLCHCLYPEARLVLHKFCKSSEGSMPLC
uniref:Uncharacterized protein n=1 Tax=Arundo donax TaxID=35708 RepID=A0A0A8ZXP1_ARUDO